MQLPGYHREMYRHLDISVSQKEFLLGECDDRDLPDPPFDPEGCAVTMERIYPFITDSNFMRKVNPALSGKLLLALMVTREELGTRFMAHSPQAWPMCSLVHALRIKGHLKGDWPELDRFRDMHIQAVFRGKLPDTANECESRHLLAMGCGINCLANRKRVKDGKKPRPCRLQCQPKRGHGTENGWKLLPAPLIECLRDYFSEKLSLRKTLYHMDALFLADSQTDTKATSPRSHLRQSIIDDLGTITFLKPLEENLPSVLPRLEFDYISLNRTCSFLFARMDYECKKKIERDPSAEMELEEDCLGDKLRGAHMFSQVLRELANSENHAQTHKGCTDFRTPVLDVVVDVLRRWIEGGAE
jgi:hypothetical protein